MAYDEGLAERVLGQATHLDGFSEKQMFGGWAAMWRGNLLVGVIGEELIVRVGPDAYAEALAEEGVRPFDFTGRQMRGWVTVAPEAVAEDPDLTAWVGRAVAFVGTLPAK